MELSKNINKDLIKINEIGYYNILNNLFKKNTNNLNELEKKVLIIFCYNICLNYYIYIFSYFYIKYNFLFKTIIFFIKLIY